MPGRRCADHCRACLMLRALRRSLHGYCAEHLLSHSPPHTHTHKPILAAGW